MRGAHPHSSGSLFWSFFEELQSGIFAANLEVSP